VVLRRMSHEQREAVEAMLREVPLDADEGEDALARAGAFLQAHFTRIRRRRLT
jgi:hypothetical protein